MSELLALHKKISLERGPWGERGPGRAARARQKGLKIEAILARARAPRTPFTPRTLSKEIVLICIISETDMLVGPVLNPIHCFRLHELLNVVWLTMKNLAGLFVCHAFSLLDSGIRYTWQRVSETKSRTMLLQTWVNFFSYSRNPKKQTVS